MPETLADVAILTRVSLRCRSSKCPEKHRQHLLMIRGDSWQSYSCAARLRAPPLDGIHTSVELLQYDSASA